MKGKSTIQIFFPAFLHQIVLTIWTVAEVFLDVSLSFSSQTAGITNDTAWGMERDDKLIVSDCGEDATKKNQ